MTQYKISNGIETLMFNSEKEACEYLGVKKSSVASCFRCGCLCKGYRIWKIGDSFHRETHTRLHKIWEAMIARCEYKKHPYYKDYGGRGITVCEKWHEYVNFRDWAIENGYSEDLTIDRIDNEKGYSPNNCRWATMLEQQRNKKSNHIVNLYGVGRTISEWAEITGISKTTIRARLANGWTDEAALTIRVRARTKGYRPAANYRAKMGGLT